MLLTVITLFSFTGSIAQSHEFRGKTVMSNGAEIGVGTIIFPLLKDTIEIGETSTIKVDISQKGRNLFYYRWGDWKSQVYRFPGGFCADTLVTVVVPDSGYYASFSKQKKCPVCLSGKNVVPILYGLPEKALLRKAKKRKAYLGGCIVSEDSPRAYCRKDDFEF